MADLNKFVEEIKGMTLVEVNDLVKMLEEEFGVSASATVAVAAEQPKEEAAVEEKAEEPAAEAVTEEAPADETAEATETTEE